MAVFLAIVFLGLLAGMKFSAVKVEMCLRAGVVPIGSREVWATTQSGAVQTAWMNGATLVRMLLYSPAINQTSTLRFMTHQVIRHLPTKMMVI